MCIHQRNINPYIIPKLNTILYSLEEEEYIDISSLDDYLYVDLPKIYTPDTPDAYSLPILQTYSQPTTDQRYQSKGKYSNIQHKRTHIPHEKQRLIHPNFAQTRALRRRKISGLISKEKEEI